MKLPTHPLFKNLTGERFGRLKVKSYAGRLSGRTSWFVECDCGTVKISTASRLQQGATSCGCLRREKMSKAATHGMSQSVEYRCWLKMRERCNNPNDKSYMHYGGRGICVCKRWDDFERFLEDMGRKPKGFEIDRIDNDGNYEPSNCHWVKRKHNARNKRSNRLLIHNGQTRCVAEWAEIMGIPGDVISTRLRRGWKTSDAITRPMRYRKRT